MSRTRCNRAAAVLVVTMIAFIATATAGPRSEAQSGRTVSVEPAGPYAPNQMVTVSWSGFKPGKTSVVLCERPQAASGNWAGCSEFTRVVGTTGADGTGSAPFRMHSHPPVVTHFEATNPRKFCADAFGGNNCAVVVSDCDVDIRAQHAARTNVDFTFVPPATRPEMILPARPEPVVDALGPQLPPEAPRLTAVGSKLAEEGTDAWAAAIAEEHGVLVDLTPVASTEVNAAVAARGAPFGVTAVPLDDAAHAALEAQGVGYTYVPLGVSAVAVGLGFNYGSASISEINLPSDVLARIYGKGNDSTPGEERITSFTNQPAIEAANGGCQFPVKIANNVFVAHYRGDRSAANLWFTSYLDAVEHDLYGHPGDFAFPASVGFTASMLTNDEIASSIYRGSYFSRADLDFVRDKVELDDSRGRWARIGFVELGSALDYHLTIATLTNGEGEPVRPTPDAILAGLEDPPPSGLLTDDDVFFPDFTAMPDTAYPMPIVFYAIVPTSHAGLPLGADGQPDVAWAQTLVDTLEFIVSDEGQAVTEAQGWVPLPESYVAAAERGIDAIPTDPAPVAPPVPPPTGPLGGFPSGGFGGAGGFGAGSFGAGAFDGGFGDGFGTGGAFDAQPVSETSSPADEDDEERDDLGSRRFDNPDIAPTVSAFAIAAVAVLVAGRVLVFSGRRRPGASGDGDSPAGPGAARETLSV